MARRMKDTGDAFRAVITRTTTHADGRVIERTTYEGPYATVGTAKSRVTFNTSSRYRNAWDKSTTVTVGHVERASTNWTRIDEPAVDTMTISQRAYDDLVEAAAKLAALEAAGVDNWEGYSFAFADEDDEENLS